MIIIYGLQFHSSGMKITFFEGWLVGNGVVCFDGLSDGNLVESGGAGVGNVGGLVGEIELELVGRISSLGIVCVGPGKPSSRTCVGCFDGALVSAPIRTTLSTTAFLNSIHSSISALACTVLVGLPAITLSSTHFCKTFK